jgi:hypothetical protein
MALTELPPANDVPLHDVEGSPLERGLGRRSVALDVGRFAEHDFDGASGFDLPAASIAGAGNG